MTDDAKARTNKAVAALYAILQTYIEVEYLVEITLPIYSGRAAKRGSVATAST